MDNNKPDTTKNNDLYIADKYFNNASYLKAISIYEKYLSEGSLNINSLRNLARSYLYTSKYEPAVKYFLLAIKKGSKDPDVFKQLAISYSNLLEYKNALIFFKKSL